MILPGKFELMRTSRESLRNPVALMPSEIVAFGLPDIERM